jgi:GT2 family glycosyltransferase
MREVRVSIIILNWNGLFDTLDCLNSILTLETKAKSIIVCDNGSSDGSQEGILSWAKQRFKPSLILELETPETSSVVGKHSTCHPFVFIQNGSNLGFAGGQNTGIRFALSQNLFDFIWTLNNDTVVNPDALSALLVCAKDNQKAAIFGSTIVHETSRAVVECAGGCQYNPLTTIVRPALAGKSLDQLFCSARVPNLDYVFGASMFVRTDVFKECGLFNEQYFLFYEEIDFCKRARKLGYELAWCRGSIVYHKSGRSIGGHGPHQHDGPVLANYHENLSPLLYTKRFHPQLLPFSMAFRFVGKLALIAKRGEWYLIRPLLAAYRCFLKRTSRSLS